MVHKPDKKVTSGLTIKIDTKKHNKSASNAVPVPAEPDSASQPSEAPKRTQKASKKSGKQAKGLKPDLDAETGPAAAVKASWTTADTHKLLEVLAAEKAAAGDGDNFKAASYQKASVELEKMRVSGAPKTWKVCRDKYRAVGVSFHSRISLHNLIWPTVEGDIQDCRCSQGEFWLDLD